jgi:Rrf2 family protein
MLSKKTRYAMVALIYLAKENGDRAVMSTEIAKSEKIPQRFLENILLELKKLGVLGSKSGKTGGYFMIKKPEDIRLSDIVRHFEGAIALLYCVSEKQYQPCEFCKDETTCKIRGVFKEIRDTTSGILEKTTLRDLI